MSERWKSLITFLLGVFLLILGHTPDEVKSLFVGWYHWLTGSLPSDGIYTLLQYASYLLIMAGAVWFVWPFVEKFVTKTKVRDVADKSMLEAYTKGKISARGAQLPQSLPFTLARAETGGQINMDGATFVMASPSISNPSIIPAVRSRKEFEDIINVLKKAHSQGQIIELGLSAPAPTDRNVYQKMHEIWPMNTIREMKRVNLPEHEIFKFQTPVDLRERDAHLGQRLIHLHNLISKYLEEMNVAP